MANETEKPIEQGQLPPKLQPEAVEDDLSEADLESLSGASLIDCPTSGQPGGGCFTMGCRVTD